MKLEDGSPFVLHEFQRTMLADYFDGTTETLILVSKKNGKTTLLAALALHHLMVTPDAECVIAAASRDQAQILLNQARGFVRRSGLDQYMSVKQRQIVSLLDEGVVRVMASDSDTGDGVIPTLAIVDELHRHKDNGAMYGVFRDGLGPRKGRMLTISTAGDDVTNSPLGRMRTAAYAMPSFIQDGAYRCARSPSGSYVMHEWALDPDDDRSDMGVVKSANPAPWQTVEALRRRFESPSTTPWQWARFACGVWLAGERAWLPTGAWAGCMDTAVKIPDGADVWLGVDIGLQKDTSAVVVAYNDATAGVVVVRATVFRPVGEIGGMDLGIIEACIREQADAFNVMGVVYDPWNFTRSAQMLSDEGLNLVAFEMNNARTVPASARLYEAICERRIVHDGDPVLAAHVAAGVTAETERGWRLTKRRAKDKIDALIALMLAFSQADGFASGGGFEW